MIKTEIRYLIQSDLSSLNQAETGSPDHLQAGLNLATDCTTGMSA